ncbi:MAG TPA: cyclase family protein [Bryobacteraceae bacterium]|jgi:hypothetical protein|nr:cyclase family protein [Bryobacteraceae bacterium]
MGQLLAAVQAARVYDLAQPFYPGMPHHPDHPPFLFGLNKKHGDYVARNGASSASEGLALGGHVGTLIDALCHFSCGGKLSSYWKEVINFDAPVRHGTIGVADMDLFPVRGRSRDCVRHVEGAPDHSPTA